MDLPVPPIGFLESLSESDRKSFRAAAHPRRYRRGAVLFGEGDTSDWIALVLTGRVKLSSFTQDGREAVIGIAGHGELLGELSAVDGEPRSATAIAIDAVEALIVSAEDFTKFLESRPGAAVQHTRVGRHPSEAEPLAEIDSADALVRDDLVGCPFHEDAALVEDVGAVDDLQRVAHIVIGDQDADAAIL